MHSKTTFRHCEECNDKAIHNHEQIKNSGLLRFARNDSKGINNGKDAAMTPFSVIARNTQYDEAIHFLSFLFYCDCGLAK
jgi:hypothetical protein